MIVRLFLSFVVLCLLFLPGHSSAQSSMSMSQAQAVADAVTRWDGQNPGDLFKAVKKANPDMGAITSLRELNKRMSSLPPEVRQAVVSNQNKAQGMIQQKIRDIRKGYRMTPQQARAAYGYGDIGSWNLTGRDKLPTAEMDVDSTVFGSDPAVTKEVRDGLSAELLRGLTDGSPEGLDLQKDFDIVLTAEGHEGASHVYETQGGKDWAKRNMRSVTIVNPDGTQRTYELGKGGDPIFELAMAQNMAELRTAAARGGEYDLLFDASGNLRPQNEIPREVWNKYTRQLKAVDYYISRSDTATGGILEMARHQKQEVIGKNFEPTSAVKKNLKFAARADNIARGARISEKLISADPILGDSANAELVQFARQINAAKSDQAVAELVKNRFGGEPGEGQVGALSNQVAKVILRYSEVAFQSEMDRIVLEINTKEGRKTALDRLANHFMLIAGEGGEYTDMAASALEAIDQVKQANDADGIDALRQNWNSLEKIRQMDDTAVNRTKNYLNQTELGKKILDKYGKMLEYASKPIFGTGKPYHTSPMLVVIEGAVEATRTRMITMVQYMGSAALWCAVVDNVRTGTDAEVAVKLGETLAMNTYYGMIASSLYAGIVQGDAKALARAIMYMIVPETALPALVEAIGKTTISLGAQVLFEHQLEAQYILTAFNEQGQVKQIDDLPGREKAARALIDELLTPGGYKLAIGMFEKAIEVMKDKKYPPLVIDEFRGTEAIGKTAMVKAIESTVIGGNHLILKDDGQLAAACASIRNYNDEIAVLGKALKLEVPETQGPDWVEGFDLGRGEKAALQKLMTARGAAQGKAKDALAAGIIRTFEERYRAEQELAKGKDEALALLSQLEKILENLKVHDDGMKALEREGTYNTIMGWFTANREKQLKAMQAVLRWRDTYLFVLEARTRAEEMAKMNIGQDYSPERRPLTGPYAPVTAPTVSTDMLKAGPPLPAVVGPILLNTGADSNNAQKYLKDVAEIGISVTKDLEAIKGGKLEDGYDRDMYRKIYRVRFEKAYWDLMFEVSGQAKGMIGTVQLWREAQRNSQREEAFTKGQALFKEDEGFKEEFRQYYALVKPTVAIAGAKETKLNSPVDLSATVTFPAGKREPKYEIRWSVEAPGKALGSGRTTSFGAGEEGSVTIRAGVWVDVKGKPQEVAWATHPIQVKKDDIKVDKKDGVVAAPVVPDKDKADPGKTDTKYVPSCSYKYSEWGECSRATKKQTRTLTGKEPQGCVEKEKPALEQGCTPPPTEEEKKAKLLACLCRCYSGASMETYVGYKPSLDPGQDPKSGYSCDNLASGPCIASGWGCWRFFIGAPNDCAKGCYEGIYGKGTYNEKDADKLRKEENKKFKKPLAVKIKASKNPADFGDIVELSAEVTGGTGGAAYSWGGCAQDAKDARAKVANTRTCSSCQATVSVTDQDGDSATDTLTIQCNVFKVKLTKEKPQSNTLPVGSQASFFAEVFSGDKPAGGTFFYVWERNPDVLFGDAKNPRYETQGGSQSRNTATFQKTGTTPVWVTVLKEIEGRKATVGESAQIQIEVINPQLELAFEPKEPWVGQEIKAKLTVKPEVREIDFRWTPVPGNAKQSLESKDGKEITFYLKDDKPAEIQVKARVPVSGEDLGEAKNTIKAKKYAVNVTGPKAMGPKPRVWKEGVGLVDVEKEIAADQIVEFAADTQPAALTGPVKYQWTVTGGPCTVSNPISREARATASAAGDCELSVAIRDKNDVPLGEGKGSFTASITRETIASGQKKAKDTADSKTRLQDAKNKVRKGDYDGAIKDAEDAARFDPANKEAAGMAGNLRKEKETIHQQIDKAKKLMDENRFADAQKELIVASNINGYYPPVSQTNLELGTRWNKYNAEVRDKVYEVRSANEKKDFGKALEIAAVWRASTKLDAYADKELKQQEDWAKQWKAQKDRQIETLKAAGEKAKAYDYAGALKQYDEGFANGQNIYNGSEPEYKEAVELRGQAFTKNKRLNELIPWVQRAAEDKEYLTVDALNNTLKTADEAIALQPNNEQLKKWREQIVARAEKTKADNDRTAAGRKYLDTARSEENTYLSQVSYVQSKSGQWGENAEVDMQSHIQKAIDNYRESLKYIPDANVEKKIKELETALEGRKKYLESYRLSVTLKNEADALYRQATQDPDIQSASPRYDEAAEKYRKSLSLYRPFNAENVEKTISVLEYYKHERWVKKYWADGQALEKEGKIVEAISIYDKAIASFHPTVPQNDRMWIQVHAQDLRNRITGAKNWRADGEAKQKAGKIAEAIASYKQSLALLPDAALTEHVRMLEGRQAEAGEKKAAADKLWQDGTALFNQGRPSDALTKFKESLGYWSDASRTKYVADMEARRAKAVALRDEGAKLQGQNRIPEAVSKYKESLTYWPDSGLSSHIATLEGKVKQDTDTAARKARAKQLRDEGYALQQKNQLQAAIGKYKESLAVWPDKQLEDYIRQLEVKSAAVPPVVPPVTPPTPPVTPPTAASFDGTYSGTVSGASTGTIQLTVSGTSVTGTVNGKYGQDAYRATLSGTLDRSTGEISTKLAGEVTGTTFQGGLNGRIQGSSASGNWHAKNQYGSPTGTWQATRGGSQRTQTTATEAATAAINIVGRWKTETIESGKVVDANYTNFNRDGSYTMEVSPEMLAGTAVCTIRGSYTLSGQTLTLKPQGSQCKFSDGTTRSEPVDKYDTISGRVSGNDRSFTYQPGGNVSVRYTRQ